MHPTSLSSSSVSVSQSHVGACECRSVRARIDLPSRPTAHPLSQKSKTGKQTDRQTVSKSDIALVMHWTNLVRAPLLAEEHVNSLAYLGIRKKMHRYKNSPHFPPYIYFIQQQQPSIGLSVCLYVCLCLSVSICQSVQMCNFQT